MLAEDPGRPNEPGVLDVAKIRWATEVPANWWRNSHRLAPEPMAFRDSAGRFSGSDLPRKVLDLGLEPVACFWESGLGRDLNSRMPDDVTIAQSDLEDRIECTVRIRTARWRIFNAANTGGRRSIGAKTSACFTADHAVSRRWACALMNADADGILYSSARQSPGLCLALFDTDAVTKALGPVKRVGSSYENPHLLASLLTENVAVIGR